MFVVLYIGFFLDSLSLAPHWLCRYTTRRLLPARARPFGNMQVVDRCYASATKDWAPYQKRGKAERFEASPVGRGGCPLPPQKAEASFSWLLPLRRFSVAAEGIFRCNYRPARAPRLDPSTLQPGACHDRCKLLIHLTHGHGPW